MLPPYLRNAIGVLIASIAIPIVAGVIARVFFFRRDDDDDDDDGINSR